MYQRFILLTLKRDLDVIVYLVYVLHVAFTCWDTRKSKEKAEREREREGGIDIRV